MTIHGLVISTKQISLNARSASHDVLVTQMNNTPTAEPRYSETSGTSGTTLLGSYNARIKLYGDLAIQVPTNTKH